MLKNYCYLNNELTILFNEKYFSVGLKDLLEETIKDLEYTTQAPPGICFNT
jgi:topoisomerase-4 subunit B